MRYQDILLRTDFPEGEGEVGKMPNTPGVYAEIHRPTNYIRIGSSAKMRTRNKGHISWAERHKNGSHTKPSEVERRGPIVDVAKEWGSEGLEYYVVSDDPRLADKFTREDVENFMHEWCRNQSRYMNMNREAKHQRRKNGDRCI